MRLIPATGDCGSIQAIAKRAGKIKPRDGQNGSWIYPHIVNGNELWLVWLDGTIEKYTLPPR